MGDVGKRAAVHESGRTFERLYKVGLHGVKQQSHDGTRGAEFGAGEGRTVAFDAQHETIDTGTQIIKVGSKTQNGH